MEHEKTMKSISKNRKAWHDYYIEEKIEAGVSLKGSEVKVLRDGHGSIVEGYAMVRDGQAWLVNAYIPSLKHASYLNHSERRDRRLLLHRNQIERLDAATRQKGYTLIPLEIYFDDNNRVKIELGLAKGKAHHDKRDAEKQKDAKKEAQKAMKRY
ncbi:SsrA-binding protein SmpB [Fluviispira vulneris]|uniref:SsrA-binding protein SmpB n=1 Tax=Fluviispira vulneris TaxID=2763012 RepID=UPI0028F3E512|nr:SsrA-binding protein SmpB [Fluviispira vulneris]